MIDIFDSAAMERALATLPSARLRALLSQRLTQLTEPAGGEFADLAHFVVVEPHDALSAIESALGFPIGVDGIGYGEADFSPSWEWSEDHGVLFELVFIFTDDGFAHVLFVPDDEELDAALLAMCREHCRRPANPLIADPPPRVNVPTDP